jgi:hypothetical protein
MNEQRKVAEELIDKIRQLPPDKIAEIEDFVEFLHSRSRDRRLARATSRLSETPFARLWDNPDDADYDSL